MQQFSRLLPRSGADPAATPDAVVAAMGTPGQRIFAAASASPSTSTGWVPLHRCRQWPPYGWNYQLNADGSMTLTALTITGLSTATGPAAGGTAVTITGTGFQTGSTVKFGTVAATVTSITPTAIVCTSPAGAAGIVDITVATSQGQSDPVAADRFTYTA